jgi:hypothetical protein
MVALIARPSIVMFARIGVSAMCQSQMDELEVPLALTRSQIDRHEGLAEQVDAGTIPAVEITSRNPLPRFQPRISGSGIV